MANNSRIEIADTVKQVQEKIQAKYNYKNPMEVPRLTKIVINRGLGEAVTNSAAVDRSLEQFQQLTGQKPVATRAKVSISNFKLRENQIIGCKVTLRSKRMYEFLMKLIHLALPKIRDFRGVSPRGFDGRGNFTMGIREDSIFPEIKDPDRVRGMDISIVTSAKTDEQAKELLSYFGMPFRGSQ